VRRFIAFFVLILLVATSAIALKVTATINPYYMIVRDIVGDRAEVSLLIGPGQNPHVFSPKLSDVKRLNEADLVVANGLELEAFLESTLEELSRKGKRVLLAGESVPPSLLSEEEDGHGETDTLEHSHSINPHVWLDPLLLVDHIIPAIVEALTEIDPESGSYYGENAEKISGRLMYFYGEAGMYLERFRGGVVIVAHPSFSYFFDRFGIVLEPVLEGVGDEPSIQELKRLVDFARSEKVIGIFSEYQQSKRPVEVLAGEASVGSGSLDPLGISRADIIDHFRWNLEEMKKVFGER